MTFVLGDMTRFDDAEELYEYNSAHMFNLTAMAAKDYNQVRLEIGN